MKYPFLIVFALALFSTLALMMLIRAVVTELGMLMDRKRLSER